MEVFAVHLGLSCFMCGLIWLIQCVHYPLFSRIPPEAFPAYESAHQRKISFVVVPVMLLELASAIFLLVITDIPVSRTLLLVNAILLTVIWISTFAFQVPLHRKLSQAYDERSIRQLVRSNWIRTIGWTLKSLLLISSIWRIDT